MKCLEVMKTANMKVSWFFVVSAYSCWHLTNVISLKFCSRFVNGVGVFTIVAAVAVGYSFVQNITTTSSTIVSWSQIHLWSSKS